MREELADAVKRIADSSDVLRSVSQLPVESREDLKQDLDRLRRLVIGRREPRIAIVGKRNVSLADVMEALGATADYEEVRERLGHGRWYEHDTPRGMFHLADLRCDDGEPHLRALDYQEPDLILAIARSEDEDVDAVAGTLIDAMDRSDDVWGTYPPGLAAIFRTEDGRSAGDFKTLQAFKDAFAARGLSRDWVDVVSNVRPGKLSQRMLTQMPEETRFALARLSNDLETKRELAYDLVRLAASLNAAIATVPVPVAGIVPITSVQLAMVSGIAYLSGRSVNIRSVGEFLTTLGINVGAGFAFRELARALVQWIPVAGPLVSASIAAGATFTLGKAATRYYLHD